MQLLQRLAEHARTRGDAEALRQLAVCGAPDRRMTYAELGAAVAAFAARLRGAVEPGRVVLLALPNSLEYHVAFLGALAAGAVVFPLAQGLAEPELLEAARSSDAAAVIGDGAVSARLRGRVDVAIEPGDVLASAALCARAAPRHGSHHAALLLQSSGTTGLPKVVRRSAAAIDAVAAACAEAVGFTPADRVLATVPISHSYGLEHGLLAPLYAGSAVHLIPGFDLTLALKQIASAGVTVVPGVPFMFEMFAQHGEPGAFGGVRCAYSAGASLPKAVRDAFAARHALRIGQVYGATEIGSVTFNDPSREPFDPAGVGVPLPGVEVRVLDPDLPDADRALPAGPEGHVAVRAASMLDGYSGEPAPLAGGFFLTGDLGRLSPAGALTITGRLKLLIDIGGQKVNPLEVERVLSQHPAVAECVVVPEPVSPTIDRLKAIVILRAGGAFSADDLRRHARERLAAHKVPRIVEVRPSLPRSPTGKVLRKELVG